MDSLPVMTDPTTGRDIDPSEPVDQLIRYCEIYREKPIIGVRDTKTNLLMGAVGKDYNTEVSNHDIYQINKNTLDTIDVKYEATFEHDNYQCRMNYTFPEYQIELPEVHGKENFMALRISTFNGQTGFRALGIAVGSWELICTNGAWGIKDVPKWTKIHVGDTVRILEAYVQNFNKQLENGIGLLDKLSEANEINEPIIKANENIVKILSSKKYQLKVKEAEEVFTRMKHHKAQYSRMNGFDIGRAVAEVARDTHEINRRTELEVIAGNLMTIQL